MPAGPAVSPARSELPVTALADWLAAQTGAAVTLTPPRLLAGGAVQQNWALDAAFASGPMPGRHRVVLRTNFQTPLPASRPKAEEFAVLRAVAAAGLSVPEPLWLCDDPAVIGRPFFVMRRMAGAAGARALVGAATREGFGPMLAEELARELAAAHRLAPGDRSLRCLGRPPAAPALAQVAQCRAWVTALAPDDDRLSAALDWLAQHAPPAHAVTLVHRDFRSGNFLVDSGRLTAVLDWEFAGWGDPHEDIGWFCAACWRAGADRLEAGGLAPRDHFYRAYEAAGGRPIDRAAVAYWEIFAHVRWAVIARQQGWRASRGDAPRHELLEAAARVAGLERDIAAMISP